MSQEVTTAGYYSITAGRLVTTALLCAIVHVCIDVYSTIVCKGFRFVFLSHPFSLQAVVASYDRVFPAVDEGAKDVDDNCMLPAYQVIVT